MTTCENKDIKKLSSFNPFAGASQAEINSIITEAFNDKNPEVFTIALGHLVKHYGVSEVAKTTGLNRQNLYKIFEGKTQPRWDTIHALLHALNIKLAV